jgi:putative ABC transport system permease protein
MNNILLIVLFTILATLILCGLSILEASISACTAIRRAIGCYVQVTNKAASKGVDVKDAQKMASIKYVKSSNFTYYLSTYGADFKAVGSNVKSNKSDEIDAYGITNLNALTNFKNKTKQISKGRALTEKDVGTNNAVISKKLAEYNKLKIGNKITLGNLKGGKETSFNSRHLRF